MSFSRRNFLLGTIALPIAAKAEVLEGLIPAARVTTYGDIAPRITAWAANDMLKVVARSMTIFGQGGSIIWSGINDPRSWDDVPPITFRRPPPFETGYDHA